MATKPKPRRGRRDKKLRLLPDDEYVNMYLREISRYKPLKAEEEARLARSIRDGDRSALERLVKANLRFVVSVARNYENQGMALTDLINEGNLGLIRAAKRFDEKKNFKFISYAVWWIRQAILQALADQSRIVKLPVNRVGMIHRIGRTDERLKQRLGRDARAEDIAGAMNLKRERVEESLGLTGKHYSLDSSVGDNSGASRLDMLHDAEAEMPDEQVTASSFKDRVKQTLSGLSGRERRVVELYFGLEGELPLTLDEIGERLSITRERVRQLKENALRRLRERSFPGLEDAFGNLES